MTGHGAKFGRKKEAAVAALLSHRTVEEAAKAVGITTKTLLRWSKEPEFDKSLREARRLSYGQSIGRLQQGSSAAATRLLKMMVDPSTPPSTRIRAADSVLAHAAKAIELEDIEARLAELERAHESQKSQGGIDQICLPTGEARENHQGPTTNACRPALRRTGKRAIQAAVARGSG